MYLNGAAPVSEHCGVSHLCRRAVRWGGGIPLVRTLRSAITHSEDSLHLRA
jgi:hypothetical protein